MTLPRRVMIIGGAGSGKSTLARRIGACLGVPVYHMDREVFWLPGWAERPKDDQVRQVERIVGLDAWVFEGNNSSTFHLREMRAELLIWIDIPLLTRLVRVVRRNVVQRGDVRTDMADGCPEHLRMLPGFLWFILSTAHSGRAKQRAFFNTSAVPKVRVRSSDDVNTVLETLT